MIHPAQPPARLLRDFAIAVDRRAVLRCLGYGRGGRPDPSTSALVDDLIAHAADLIAPAATWQVQPVRRIDDTRIELADGSRFRGAVGRYIGRARHIALFVATIGSGVEDESRRLMQEGRLLEGAIMDAVGSDAVEQVADAVSDAVAAEAAALDPDYGTTLRYSPGYCGMHLTQQRALFAALDAAALAAVGVTLSDVCLMQPIKSVSGLIGIGPEGAIEDIGTPCRLCNKTDCMMRRED